MITEWALEGSIPGWVASALRARFAPVWLFKGSSTEEKLTEKDESQNLHVRTLDGSTAPHCEHVFVTGEFCAADASTPVRREPC